MEMASLTFDTLLFPDHPYGLPEDGYTETIQAIQRQDLLDFHKSYFRPENMVIVIVGAVEPKSVFDLFERLFSQWHNPYPQNHMQLPPVSSPEKPSVSTSTLQVKARVTW
ncbi:MAG: insulinase family protein [Rhodopseudomonas palustris]|nr:insulinase family protein [Rhodopseudomonas palustris]